MKGCYVQNNTTEQKALSEYEHRRPADSTDYLVLHNKNFYSTQASTFKYHCLLAYQKNTLRPVPMFYTSFKSSVLSNKPCGTPGQPCCTYDTGGLPGSVSQSEAPLKADAPVHQQFPEEQWGVSR